MVDIFEIDCGMSWKSRRRSSIRNGDEFELYLPKLVKYSTCHHLPAESAGM
jgi:hypothetical protein